jgi:hypothetical protein
MNKWIRENLIMIVAIIFVIAMSVYLYYTSQTEGFEDYKSQDGYKKQVKLLSDTYSDASNGKRPFAEGAKDVPESEQIFTNFYSLGCRFTGFLGPTGDSYYDPDIAVQNAVAAGCRVFILEIDYIEKCSGDKKYFPKLVVRDKQGKLMINTQSNHIQCDSSTESSIHDVCEKINFYAFASSCQNASDPVVLVLYFLQQPPGAYNSSVILDYYSNVAKMIAPLSSHFLQNELTGTYYRQKQESQLLMNKLAVYNKKVIVCSNANTSGFREKAYSANEDLDFLTNLRLSYTQTQLGITDNTAGSTFGVLETADDFMIIPTDRADTVVNDTKLKWTVCFSKDPDQSVSKETYTKITSTFGVHCVPILLHDIPNNQYMFEDNLFKRYSFIPKPKPLRFTKPPTVVPSEPNPSMDANKGFLRSPTV